MEAGATQRERTVRKRLRSPAMKPWDHRFPLAFALLAVTSCVALDHTNPLDTHADVTIDVTASRDTLTAVGQSVLFTATVGPDYPNALITWIPAVGKSYEKLAPEGSGPTYTLTWVAAGSEVPNAVTAWVGPHSRSHKVVS